ncbi:MAG TPA: V-type ATPase subunit [Spirochaetia bacterium]|nr:V-type ATPase subunit [Spirochaetia bacterium]
MSKMFRYEYVQAKLHAIIGSSYVRRDIRPLIRGADVHAIADAVLPGRQYDLPEIALARQLQEDLQSSMFNILRRILKVLSPAPPVLVHLFRLYEFRMVRTFAASILHSTDGELDQRKVRIEPFWDLKEHANMKLKPDAEYSIDVLQGSIYEWVLDAMQKDDVFQIEVMLDRKYFAELLELARAVRGSEGKSVRDLVELEINLQNYVWILRLRTYFKWTSEQIVPLLVPVGRRFPDRNTRALLEMQLDAIEPMGTFRHSWLFASQPTVDFRRIDPALAEQEAELHLFRAARALFYGNPFSLGLVYAFCKLKQFEVSRLTTVLEGIKMMLPEDELIAAVGTL